MKKKRFTSTASETSRGELVEERLFMEAFDGDVVLTNPRRPSVFYVRQISKIMEYIVSSELVYWL